VPRIFLSAHSGEGLADLRGLLAERLSARLGGSPCPDDDAGAEDSAQ